MSINNQNTYLNIEDAHLRLRTGNVYAQGINIGGITVDTAHGLQRVSDTGNVTSNTLQFANATTGFTTTANATIGRDLTVTGNVTVSSNLTVTGNAVVSDDLTVTENLFVSNNLTVTGNTFYTNPAAVLVDSNVVTEYTGPHDRPLRKYPEVELDVNAMTSPGVGGYIVAHSGRYSTAFAGWTAFGEEFTTTNAENSSGAWIDGNPGSYAKETGDAHNGVVGSITTAVQTADTLKLASNTPVGAWISLELPTSIKLQRIEMRARLQHASETNLNEVALQSFPREFGIWGYDGSNWVLLKSVTGHSANSAFGYTPTHVNATTAYNKYAIVVTRTNAVGGINSDDRNFTAIGQLYFYGHEEGSASLDTTLKSVYNVPATTGTQLEVYYDGQDYTQASDFAGTGGVVDKVGGDQDGTAGTGVSFDSTYKAFVFDGTANGNITSSVLPSDFIGDIQHTVSLWFKIDSSSTVTNPCLFDVHKPGAAVNHQRIDVRINSGDSYQFHYDFWNNYTRWKSPFGSDLPKDEWIHMTATYSGGLGSGPRNVYMNGRVCELVYQGVDVNTTPLAVQADSILLLGKRPDDTSLFDGSIANFRLYSKALNAGQVQELYDYQKDYFLGSKSQVTLYKGHLGVGVTEPSGQLELAGDERLQEYPPGPMDGYETLIPGHGVFCASSSAIYNGSYPAYKAFDKIIPNNTSDNQWVSQSGSYDNASPSSFPVTTGTAAVLFENRYGSWIRVKMPYKIFLKKMVSYIRADRDYEHATSGVVYGSNDGHSHDIIYTFNDVPVSDVLNLGVRHEINANIAYSTYTFQITKLEGQRTFTPLGELKFFGTPGPTTLDKGSLSLTRSLDVPRISRYDVDTETPRPEKLVVDFDTTVNSSPTDISGKGNHGTLAGANPYSAADKAFKFVEGTANYIKGDTGLTGNFTHSISMWFNASHDGQLFWTGINANSGDRINIYFSDDGGLGGNTTTPQIHYTFKGHTHYANVNPDQWYHLVCTYSGTDSSNRKIYIDGVPAGSDDITDGSRPSGDAHALNIQTSTFYLSQTNAENQNILTGKISNFKLYNVALEPSEVKKLYNLGRTGRSMVISDTAVGIGKVPEAQLDVRGNLNVDGLIKSNSPAFSAYEHDGYSETAAGYVTLGNTFVNKGGCYDTSNGIFTAPISGTYRFTVDATLRSYSSIGNGSGATTITLYINNANWNPTSTSRPLIYQFIDPGTNHQHVSGSLVRNLNAGDTVRIYGIGVASGTDINWGNGYGRFIGYLIS